MSFSITEEMKKELRDECMKEAYKHFKLTKIISDNRFYFYLSSQNLRGFTAGGGGNNNGLSFVFPPEISNHITDGRIKVLDCSLPPILNNEQRLEPKYYIHLTGGILKKNNYITSGGSVGNGNPYFHGDIVASGTIKELISKTKNTPFPAGIAGNPADNVQDGENTIVIFKDGQTRAVKADITAKIANAGAGDEVVGGYEASQQTGRFMMLDDEWRACNNPAGKTATITFARDNIVLNGPYDLTKEATDVVRNWNMTLCVELLPDFNRNDKIMF